MEIPSKESIETLFIPKLNEIFKNIEMKYIDDMEFSYYELCFNEPNDGFITIDNEALEISLDYAFFRFIYANEDLIAYKVVGTDYEAKGLEQLFEDAIAFIKANLYGNQLQMQYTLSGSRMICYEMYRLSQQDKELLYSYRYTSLPDMFFKTHVKTRTLQLA